MYGVLFAALLSFGKWAVSALLGVLGTAVVSTQVYQPLFTWMQSKITNSLNGTGSEAYGFLMYVGIPQAISVIFAAITLRLGLKAAQAAFAKRSATNA